MGFSHPLPPNLIKGFLKACDKVLVVEEGEPYMEEAVKAMAQEEALTLKIRGKAKDLFSRLYEYSPGQVRQGIATFLGLAYTPAEVVDLADVPPIPQRPPTLCAGCSHRATYLEIKKAAEGMQTIYPTDIGCYTLGLLPPLSTADFLLCMGSSAGTSGGFSQVTDKKVIAFIGDSTFFHSGIPGLINGIYNNHNFTLVILDNGTTAMTGHQPNPGVDMTKLKLEGYNRVSIEAVVKAIGIKHITVIKPYKVKKSIDAIKEAINFQGVSVIISEEPCALYAKALEDARNENHFASVKSAKIIGIVSTSWPVRRFTSGMREVKHRPGYVYRMCGLCTNMSRKRYFAEKGDGDGIGKKWNTGVRFSGVRKGWGSDLRGIEIKKLKNLGI